MYGASNGEPYPPYPPLVRGAAAYDFVVKIFVHVDNGYLMEIGFNTPQHSLSSGGSTFGTG